MGYSVSVASGAKPDVTFWVGLRRDDRMVCSEDESISSYPVDHASTKEVHNSGSRTSHIRRKFGIKMNAQQANKRIHNR